MSKTQKILALLKKGKDIKEIAKTVRVKPAYVYYIRWKDKTGGKAKTSRKKKVSRLARAAILTTKEVNALFKPLPDLVNSPPHYKAGGVETIDFIESKDFNYRLGNVIKYVSRAGRKVDSDPVQDLEKAMWYLQREINARKEA